MRSEDTSDRMRRIVNCDTMTLLSTRVRVHKTLYENSSGELSSFWKYVQHKNEHAAPLDSPAEGLFR
jgi:hypothetical protein